MRAQGGWLGPALVLGAAAAFVALERRRPLRPSREPRDRRDARNLAFAALSALTVRLVEAPLAEAAARFAARRRWGLLNLLPVPRGARVPLGLALLDYTLFLWHILTHRVPLLWRFHRIHHADLDLSATTALRFHFAELALSAPWRALQVMLTGVSARELAIWQQATLLSILFHHANLRLPLRLERALAAFVMTPRLHGIHHSVDARERESNWSSGLTLWDRLHRTYRFDRPQSALTIGVPDLRDRRALALPRILALPFHRG